MHQAYGAECALSERSINNDAVYRALVCDLRSDRLLDVPRPGIDDPNRSPRACASIDQYTTSVRRFLGDELADSTGLVRAAALATKAAAGTPAEGRVMYAGMHTLAVPSDPVARLSQSATTLRERRADGHAAALVGARVGGTEAHVLYAPARGIHPPESLGRIHHLPKERPAAVRDGLREWDLIDHHVSRPL